MKKFPLISAALAIVFLSASYFDYANYNPSNAAREIAESEHLVANAVAEKMANEQRECLAKGSSDWCNQDMSRNDFYEFAKSDLARNKGIYPIEERQSSNWKFYIFMAVIFGAFAISQLLSKDESNPPTA